MAFSASQFQSPRRFATTDVILTTLIVTWIAVLVDVPYLRQLLSALCLFVIPGLLILRILRIRPSDLWENVVLIVGLSITFLMLFGLTLNQISITLNLPPLLTSDALPISLLACLFVGTVIARMMGSWDLNVPYSVSFSLFTWILLALATILPVASALGAERINRLGNNDIALLSLLLIVILFLAIAFGHRRISARTLPYSLFMIGLSMLISFSLRSWHVSGWDIHQEFYVYQLTETSGLWQFENFRDPYNASISITILPTVINAFLDIDPEYVFKSVYQLIFALVPVVIFLIARRYVSLLLSFFAAAFFIFQPWFIQPMPALARQQIALLFFALLLWILFDSNLLHWQKNTLLAFFGVSLVTAHYSTTYIALGILTLTFLGSMIVRTVVVKDRPSIRAKLLPAWLLAFLWATTIYWTIFQTQITGGATYIAQITIDSMRTAILSDLRSEDVWQTFRLTEEHFDLEDVYAYVNEKTEEYQGNPKLYHPNTYYDFQPTIVRSQSLEGAVSNVATRTTLASVFGLSKQITKLLTLAGAVILLRKIIKPGGADPEPFLLTRGFHQEFILVNFIGLVILMALLVLPVISLYYNSFRLFMQVLIISSVSMVLAAVTMLHIIPKPRIRERIIAILLILFFLHSTGVSSYIVGGRATMNLNSFGDPYDKFYTQDHEVYAAEWLSLRRDPQPAIYADEIASLRLISFGDGIIDTENGVLPSTITRDAYVYLGSANLRLGIAYATQKGRQISYNYPIEFLDEHKNLIYDNGGSWIFK